ncbi:MAG: lysine--tRNA ligase [Clostridia bacterium]|nr:lysine--tRNA ligase [Clostridia bacterium]
MTEENREEQLQQERELSEILQIRRDKLAALRAEGRDPFLQVRFDRTADSRSIAENFETMENQDVAVAGRIMSKRDMGKASFYHIQDHVGQIQIYARVDELGEEEYDRFKKLDIGDIIGLKGFVFRTRRGEISVHVREYVLLSKSLRPLPEKFHGLKDVDTRYRQRYVDLIVNPEVKETFIKRSRAVTAIRSYFDNLGYLEVDTPVLQTVQGGATARPFVTHHNALDIDLYLRIATELYLKRCIIGGFDRVYEIGRLFRNEGMDTRHNPEFTTIEFYEAYTDINGMMERTEGLMREVCRKVNGSLQLPFGDVVIDMEQPFRKATMTQLVKEYAGVDFDQIPDLEAAKKAAEEHHIKVEPKHQKGDILSLFFEEYCESKLIQPTFVLEHPVEISPLAKRVPGREGMTQRFELFINGAEYANAFSELNDPLDQRERFENQMKLRAMGDLEASELDEDFLTAMEYGMPPTGGCGIGIDRFVMLLTGNTSIRDVLLFPTMKPEGAQKKIAAQSLPIEDKAAPQPGEAEEKIDFSNVVIEPLFEDLVDFETFSKSDFRAVKVLECEAVKKSKKLLKFTLDDGSGEKRTILSGIHAYYEPEELIGKTCIAIVNLPPRPMMGIESCGMLISAVHKEGEEEKLHLLMVDPHIPAGAKLY